MSPGRLSLDVFWDGASVTEVAVRSTRPQAARLLRGRGPDEALAMVPLLFSLCRQGQTLAARLALTEARGLEADPQRGTAALVAEAAREHLGRLLLDWPELLGREPEQALWAPWHRRLARVTMTDDWAETGPEFVRFCEQRLLDRDAAEWLAGPDRGRLGAASPWNALLTELALDTAPSPPTPILPPGLGAQACYEGLGAALTDDFARRPTWRGEAAETGAYARWRCFRPDGGGSEIAGRARARLAELAFLVLEVSGRVAARPRCSAFSPAPGLGFAVVETARGLLIHSVRLALGRIAEYRIVAPTEWNFHPAGAFRDGLLGLAAGDMGTVRRRAWRLALALDPCTAFDVAVRTVPRTGPRRGLAPYDRLAG